MIKINLLPQGRRPTRAASTSSPGGSQPWLIAYLVAAVAWCVCLTIVYFVYDDRLAEQELHNAGLQREIDEFKSKSAQLEQKQAELQQSKDLDAVVAELDRARTGPTRVLMELARMLSVDGGPTIDPARLEQLRRENPLAGFNRSWDPRRLWVTSFEEDARLVKIRGLGRSNEDVAEFLQRLNLSELFTEVTLQKTQSTADPDSKLDLIGFELSAKVRY